MILSMLYWLYILLPFSFALNITSSIDLPVVRVFIILTFFLWLANGLWKKKIKIAHTGALSLLLFFFLWSSLSFLWAIDGSWSVRKIIFLFNFFLLFLVLQACSNSSLKRILQGFVIGAGVIAFVGCVESGLALITGVAFAYEVLLSTLPLFLGNVFGQVVTEYPSLLVNINGNTLLRATGFFPDPHIFSMYLGMGLPFALIFWYQSKKIGYAFGSGVIFLGIILSFSRGAYIGLFLSTFFIGFYFWQRVSVSSGVRFIWLIAFLCALLALLMSPFGTRLKTSFFVEDGSRAERIYLFEQASAIIKNAPILGAGIGNYPLAVNINAEKRNPAYAHNLWLDLWAETGVVGMLLFSSFLGAGFYSGQSQWKKTKDPFFLAALASLVFFFGHTFFETPIFSVHILPALFLVVAFLLVKKKI